MGYVMKASKAGYPVLTTGSANLSFSSDLATHSIFNISTLNISSGSSSGTINHNLGFIPKTWVFYVTEYATDPALRRVPKDGYWTNDSIDYYITTSSVVVEVEDTSHSYSFKVVIFTRSPNI